MYREDGKESVSVNLVNNSVMYLVGMKWYIVE